MIPERGAVILSHALHQVSHFAFRLALLEKKPRLTSLQEIGDLDFFLLHFPVRPGVSKEKVKVRAIATFTSLETSSCPG